MQAVEVRLQDGVGVLASSSPHADVALWGRLHGPGVHLEGGAGSAFKGVEFGLDRRRLQTDAGLLGEFCARARERPAPAPRRPVRCCRDRDAGSLPAAALLPAAPGPPGAWISVVVMLPSTPTRFGSISSTIESSPPCMRFALTMPDSAVMDTPGAFGAWLQRLPVTTASPRNDSAAGGDAARLMTLPMMLRAACAARSRCPRPVRCPRPAPRCRRARRGGRGRCGSRRALNAGQ